MLSITSVAGRRQQIEHEGEVSRHDGGAKPSFFGQQMLRALSFL